jgi:cell division protein FtsZ
MDYNSIYVEGGASMGNDMLELESAEGNEGARILVVGVGGGGNNAVDRMIEKGIRGVEFVTVNTDKQQLDKTKAPVTVQIGEKLTKGLGAGANPEIGQKSAEESKDELTAMLKGADMVFITCGMGGGTGTGATPVIASIAKSMGILTVGIVTKPFKYECKRYEYAEQGIERLKECVDTLIVIPNDKINVILRQEKLEYSKAQKAGKKTRMPVKGALDKANQVLHQGVQGVTDLIRGNGDINLDFADICRIMRDKGTAHLGIGTSTPDNIVNLDENGEENFCLDALMKAISSPLLETSIVGATDVIVYFSGSVDMLEISDAMEYLAEIVGSSTNVIMGTEDKVDESSDEIEVKVTVIATGMSEQADEQAQAPVREAQKPVQQSFRNTARTVNTTEQNPVRRTVVQEPKEYQQRSRVTPIQPGYVQKPVTPTSVPASAVTREDPAVDRADDSGPQIPNFIDKARNARNRRK